MENKKGCPVVTCSQELILCMFCLSRLIFYFIVEDIKSFLRNFCLWFHFEPVYCQRERWSRVKFADLKWAVFRKIMKISFEYRQFLERGPALGKVLENPRSERCFLPGSAGKAVSGCSSPATASWYRSALLDMHYCSSCRSHVGERPQDCGQGMRCFSLIMLKDSLQNQRKLRKR